MEIKNYLAAAPRRKLHAMVSPRGAMQELTAAPWFLDHPVPKVKYDM